MQVNSNHWATGENHTETLPQWNYRSILAHYYTEVNLSNINDDALMPVYRWNPLSVRWADTNSMTPPLMSRNSFYNVRIDYQNTGQLDWVNNISLIYRWEKPDGTPVFSSGLLAGNLPTGGALYQTIWVLTPATTGDYILIFDMRVGAVEFFHNREPRKSWYSVKYGCPVGGNGGCVQLSEPIEYKYIYLPVIIRNR
jgi:hypothetical protein